MTTNNTARQAAAPQPRIEHVLCVRFPLRITHSSSQPLNRRGAAISWFSRAQATFVPYAVRVACGGKKAEGKRNITE